jgi:hypothetical protein
VLVLVLLLASCSAPQRSNRYDNKACEPTCQAGKLCRGGVCIADPCLPGMVYIDEAPQTKKPFCISSHEAATSPAGRATWGRGMPVNLFPEQAAQACHEAGAQLCDDLQWGAACDGRTSESAQGNPPDLGACNLGGNLAETGSFEGCEGGYTGLFDMLGNLGEWTISTKDSHYGARVPASWLVGGHYLSSSAGCGQNGDQIDTKTTTVPDTAGFRCCVPCAADDKDKGRISCKLAPSWLRYRIRGTDSGDLEPRAHRMWGSSPEDIWMISGPGAGGDVAHFDGKLWTRDAQVSAFGGDPVAVWGTGQPGEVWLLKGAHLLRHDGKVWKEVKVSFPLGIVFKSIWGNDAQTIWIVGATNGGTTDHLFRWDGTTLHTVDLTKLLISDLVDGWADADSKEVWCVAQGGQALHSTDGTTWMVKSITPKKVTILDIHGSAADNVWAVGEFSGFAPGAGGGGVVIRYNGTDWEHDTKAEELASGNLLSGVWALSPSEVWIAGGIIMRYDAATPGWVEATLRGQDSGAVWFHGSGEVWLEQYRRMD